MRFIVDAQLPRALASHLVTAGHDAVHVKQLPNAGRTSDAEISAVADQEGRIVVTKDADFREGHLLRGTPGQLLRVATGNIKNADLISPVTRLLPALETAFSEADLVDLSEAGLTIYARPNR
jgi:predicted nuclease of predicted toxin-antitoxin system